VVGEGVELNKAIRELFEVMGTLRVLDPRANEVVGLARAYLSDAGHFLGKGNRDDALEAYAIAWAYLDALLHLGLIDVEDHSLFTVER